MKAPSENYLAHNIVNPLYFSKKLHKHLKRKVLLVDEEEADTNNDPDNLLGYYTRPLTSAASSQGHSPLSTDFQPRLKAAKGRRLMEGRW